MIQHTRASLTEHNSSLISVETVAIQGRKCRTMISFLETISNGSRRCKRNSSAEVWDEKKDTSGISGRDGRSVGAAYR